ncbi:hypothetical protein [uncultured Algimonas sp.]|uniref:hypothetical protein n=1 Tax=uncultured Algimonas sp. TaxID=1547920 RepID=UPI0026387106|nr:hypothetical protein [uncultured Algimonas sp.]
MSVRRILSLKRASIRSRIDAVAAKEAALTQRIASLNGQSDGLGVGEAGSDFQVAAMTMSRARAIAVRLDAQRTKLRAQRTGLARELLSLDVADRTLADEEAKAARLAASRAADRA